jgi:hypothetical protein
MKSAVPLFEEYAVPRAKANPPWPEGEVQTSLGMVTN